VTIPVIASSGVGRPEYFAEAFAASKAVSALAAGIFHRREMAIGAVKELFYRHGIEVRQIALNFGGFKSEPSTLKGHPGD
jgi:imidazole glycerol-phosphate synthase